MESYELITNFRREQSSGFLKVFYKAGIQNSDALSDAALSYRSADGPDSEAPLFWPLNEEYWDPQDKVSNLIRAAALYQEAFECKEKQHGDGSVFQHAAIEVAEEINSLLIHASRSYL